MLASHGFGDAGRNSPQALATAVCMANSSVAAEAVLQLVLPLNSHAHFDAMLGQIHAGIDDDAQHDQDEDMPTRTGFFMRFREQRAHATELIIAVIDELFGVLPKVRRGGAQRGAYGFGGGIEIGVRAFAGLGDDAVDQAEIEQIRRGYLQRGGRSGARAESR